MPRPKRWRCGRRCPAWSRLKNGAYRCAFWQTSGGGMFKPGRVCRWPNWEVTVAAAEAYHEFYEARLCEQLNDAGRRMTREMKQCGAITRRRLRDMVSEMLGRARRGTG